MGPKSSPLALKVPPQGTDMDEALNLNAIEQDSKIPFESAAAAAAAAAGSGGPKTPSQPHHKPQQVFYHYSAQLISTSLLFGQSILTYSVPIIFRLRTTVS